ncbi:uncharacterized protein ACLA_007570 [Aspergillus clavatus NRRL 1]|uniref:DUF7703 domain-containing protein n=1 Tax=Aspergillus clavatus (strain ATCC 1007 / CBS 513.65 / DSM 816 / NCTC 3887 / NRRL 1 / QM 1276 / 107) TaxID=344612 RepID=A1CDS1_ASPCL|nr:uncharacterized protein ACLA_007570 [Aspergillus clavatus NRRL 1]EAW11998.1 conserved hypothetical protein [Aspergillus clavatus NRRL 1]
MSTTQDPLDGISGELANHRDGLKAVLFIFSAISFYNVVELVVLVLSTFRRWRGLYFWSLLLSGCFGVVPYSLGFLLKFFTSANSTLSVTMLSIGWWTMVTGQAFVLYSRLHLVLRDERVLRRVLVMIIANVFLLHIPTTVLTYGSNVVDRSPVFVQGYNIMEKLQMTGFTIQEVVISSLYVWETVKLLRLGSDKDKQRIMYQLVGINIIIVLMDMALLGLEYASYYAVQITLKGAIYSLKLKLEFAVLGRLVDVIHGNRRPIMVRDSVHLCSLEFHAGPNDRGNQAGVMGDGNICEISANNAAGNRKVQTATAEHFEGRIPDGKILAMTEFSTWIERRPRGGDGQRMV